ncbi:MAG: amino acid synthesis family protein [Streptosporangiales bacterium]|nr:amino acid synthesis family protein [Streptosporangiales bacterium]
MAYQIRKRFHAVEEISHDGGPVAAVPLRKAVVAAVIANLYADGYAADLAELIGPSAELGAELTRQGIELLGGRAEGYGKGAIVGTSGEQEHGVACLTTPFGDALRAGVGGGAAWVSSATKVGAAGTALDIPLAYKDALFVRSHYDAMTLCIADAPRPAEIVVAIVLSSGGRVHHRVGGLSLEDAVGDGVR